jgi:hypothetical protein
MPLVWAAAYFAAVLLDTTSKLKVLAGYVLKAAKRVFGIPEFHYYCIADGLTSLFMRYLGRIIKLTQHGSSQGTPFTSSVRNFWGTPVFFYSAKVLSESAKILADEMQYEWLSERMR